MRFEDVATASVDQVAEMLTRRATNTIDHTTDIVADTVHQLITQRLSPTATGRRLLARLAQDPTDRANRTRLAEMLTDEADSDPHFGDTLGRFAAQAGILPRPTHNSSGDIHHLHADHGTIRIRQRKFHIGHFEFNTGGLIALIAIPLVLAGGTTAFVAGTMNTADLSSAVGTWTQQPGAQMISGFSIGPMNLTIAADGAFTFSMQAKMNIPNAGTGPSAPPPGFGDFSLDCTGTASADGDHFTFRTTSGFCGTFEAKLAPDGKLLDLFIDNGSVDGSVALRKVQ
ncbi:hypothetical protein [Actinokineospora enzanensis]|uniref:hypothetical protein n=1 Tax=Actinokineospora enzanensis TaxID=155975 RepID=UPI00037D8126|nr:hypothetical protein [Actinokineospora enzanensis]